MSVNLQVVNENQILPNLSHDKHNGIDISFKNIVYSVQTKNKENQIATKNILQGVSGFAKQGELLAIMGASGAGKTSLLNTLSCRVDSSKTSKIGGELLANGKPYDGNSFGKFAGYVMQFDILMSTLTPYESFMFVSNLKLKCSAQEKVDRVNSLLDDLKLTDCKNTRIGDNLMKGVSGGERKRTSIGVELITNPGVLFLDEPTTGLDSFTAWVIINNLKNLATTQNKTIIFTIHQPNSDIFKLFDRILLLVEGRIIYQESTRTIIDYFSQIGYQCPKNSNATDYFMSIMSTQNPEDSKIRERFKLFFESYETKQKELVDQQIQNLSTDKLDLAQYAGNGFFFEFKNICYRSWLNFIRNQMLLKGRLFKTVFMCFLFSALYFQLERDSKSGYSDKVSNFIGGLFFASVNQMMISLQTTILTFPAERALFLKEVTSKMYTIESYYLGKSTTEFPFMLFFPIVFSSICYYIIGFNSGFGNFLFFTLILMVLSFNGNSLGIMAGCVFSDIKAASTIAPMMIIPFMLFGGFFLNRNDFPVWLGWFEWLSPFKYSTEALVHNEFNDYNHAVIDFLGFDFEKWECFGLLMALGILYRIIGYIGLKLLVRKLQ